MHSAAIAQDQSLHPQMHQNLYDMSELLKDISLQLSTSKMPPEAQKTAGEITHRMSEILLDLSGLGVHYNHQNKIKKMKKRWDPWAKMVQH
jgi:hypothetical protein